MNVVLRMYSRDTGNSRLRGVFGGNDRVKVL